MTNKIVEEKGKIVFVDWNVFMYRALFGWLNAKRQVAQGQNQLILPPQYLCLSMILACLKKVGLNKEDIVICAVDCMGSWRKDLDRQYKSSRKQKRKDSGIDFDHWFEEFDKLKSNLSESTNWHFVSTPKLEADDFIAEGARYFKDKIVTIISIDSDFEQLAVYKNVRLFSPKTKKYKFVENPLGILENKIKKETADDLTNEVITKADYKIRKSIVSLLTLPKWVVKHVHNEFKQIKLVEDYDLDKFPYDALKIRFKEAYKKTGRIDYEKFISRLIKHKIKDKIEKKHKKDKKIQSVSIT